MLQNRLSAQDSSAGIFEIFGQAPIDGASVVGVNVSLECKLGDSCGHLGRLDG